MMLLYEDAVARAEMKETGASLGHIIVTPKQEVQVLSQLPEDVAVQLFYIASYAATAVFEGLGAQGTNILVYEGDAVELHVVARGAQDGMDLFWNPQRAEPAALQAITKQVSDSLFYVGKGALDERKAPAVVVHPDEPNPVKKVDPKDNYMLRQLQRKP